MPRDPASSENPETTGELKSVDAVLVHSGTSLSVMPGFGVPVFRLEPGQSKEMPASGDVQQQRIRSYGGQDLIVSGSMSETCLERPSFALPPSAVEPPGSE